MKKPKIIQKAKDRINGALDDLAGVFGGAAKRPELIPIPVRVDPPRRPGPRY